MEEGEETEGEEEDEEDEEEEEEETEDEKEETAATAMEEEMAKVSDTVQKLVKLQYCSAFCLNETVASCGGVSTIWSGDKLKRWFLLPACITNHPFTYKQCLCNKCCYALGRSPATACDVVRNYQLNHPDQVILFAPPSTLCSNASKYPEAVAFMLEMKEVVTDICYNYLRCRCARCETGRGRDLDERFPVNEPRAMSESDIRFLTKSFWRGEQGSVLVIKRRSHARNPRMCSYSFSQFQAPYPANFYNYVGIAPPACRWYGGKPDNATLYEDEKEYRARKEAEIAAAVNKARPPPAAEQTPPPQAAASAEDPMDVSVSAAEAALSDFIDMVEKQAETSSD